MAIPDMLQGLTPVIAFQFSPSQIAFVIVVAFLLFGAQKIPELMRSLGRAQGEFLKARRDFEDEMRIGEGKTGDQAQLDKARERARELGIDPKGKDLETLKAEIADKVLEG